MNETDKNQNDTQSAITAGAALANIEDRVMHLEAVPVAWDGAAVRVLSDVIRTADERADAPRRRIGVVKLTDEDSFTTFVLRWGSASTVIYADTERFAFTAVINDHPGGNSPADAGWRDHRAVYSCPRSPEWITWTAADGKPMSQTEFGDFIEARLEDLSKGEGMPAPLDVLQVARKLHVRTKGTYEREVNPTTGDSVLINKTETETGSTVIPRAFGISIPVFESGVPYYVEARVRFALVEGRPAFTFTLHRRKEIERHAFTEVRNSIMEATKRPIFSGTP